MANSSKIIPLSRVSSSAAPEPAAGAEVTHFRRREQAAIDKLAPASWDEAKRSLIPLFDLPMRNDANEAGTLAGLRASCNGEPLWAIEQTVLAFVTGREGQCFCPNSAQFGVALRKLTDPVRESVQRIRAERRRAEEAAAEQPTGPISEKTRKIADRFLEQSRAIADEQRAWLTRKVPDSGERMQNGMDGPSPAKRVWEMTAAKRKERLARERDDKSALDK